MLVSALNFSKPSTPRLRETRATWELSIACNEIPIIIEFRTAFLKVMLTCRANIDVNISDNILDGFHNLLEDGSFS
jgi:hypothetical protein